MTKPGFSLIDLGELSAPLTKLIESVSDAIGVLYEPRRIREKAKAEADAAVTKTEGDIKVQDLLSERAARRIGTVETRRQNNIESIILIAVDQMPDSVSDRPVDQDWIARFFDYSKDVGNEELQTVWARLLVGEVAEPGSYSLRTLNAVSLMRPAEASLFQKSTNYVWNNSLVLYYRDEFEDLMKNQGLTTNDLAHLIDMGTYSRQSFISYDEEDAYSGDFDQ